MLAHIPTPYWSCMNLLEVGSFLPSLLVEYSFFLALLRNYLIAWEGLRVYSGLNNVIYFGGIGHWNRVLLHIYHRLAANSPSSSLSLLSVALYPAITYLYIVIMSIKARYSKGFSQLRGSWAHCPWTPPAPVVKRKLCRTSLSCPHTGVYSQVGGSGRLLSSFHF